MPTEGYKPGCDGADISILSVSVELQSDLRWHRARWTSVRVRSCAVETIEVMCHALAVEISACGVFIVSALYLRYLPVK